MNYGLQISASGAMTAMYRQDVFTNNLANATSVGFKPDIAAVKQRLPVRAEDALPNLPSDVLLERLGGGVLMARNRVKFDQGSLERTSSPLDLAVQGRGFFVVRDDSDPSGDRMRLTRDGRFVRDVRGRVVAAGTGMPLLDTANNPITLDDSGKITIDGDGTVTQNGKRVAQIQLTDVPDPSRLVKKGHSVFSAPATVLSSRRPADGTIRQNAVEAAAVDEIDAIMKISSAGRDFESNIGMIQQVDRLMDRAINQLGRVS